MIILLNKATQTSQKLRGGYYTPYPIAEYLWNWVKAKKTTTLLEPAAGDGALIKPIEDAKLHISAVELVTSEAYKLAQLKKTKPNLEVFNEDFYAWYEKKQSYKYDAVLSNPPYIRYQYLTPEQREIQSQILKKNGLRPNKLINSWVPFVIAGISMLKENGRIGLVIPTDFLQVTYAKQLRQYLIKELQQMVIITFQNSVFPGTQQDFLLLLGEKGHKKLRFKHAVARDINNIPSITNLISEDPPTFSSAKWTDLSLNSNNRQFINSFKKEAIPFTELTKTQVGITTGANPFFSLTNEDVVALHAQEYVKPLLGRSVSVTSCIFNKEVLKADAALHQKIWLLDLNGYAKENLPIQLQNYISSAEKDGVNNAYKLRIRNVWYQIPNIWSPDAFLLRRIGSVPKLVLNDINGVSTDTFHRVKILDNISKEMLLFAFYSSVSLTFLELAGRSYGGGALEILPGDLANLYLPRLPYESKISFVKEVQHLDTLLKTNDIQQISKYADSVLVQKLNVHFDGNRFRNILARLQSMRIK